MSIISAASADSAIREIVEAHREELAVVRAKLVRAERERDHALAKLELANALLAKVGEP